MLKFDFDNGNVYDDDILLGKLEDTINIVDSIMTFVDKNGAQHAAPSEYWGPGAQAIAVAWRELYPNGKPVETPEPGPSIPTPEERIMQLENDTLTAFEAIAEIYEMMIGGGD